MPYTPNTTWVDGSGGGTPLSAARLNNMEPAAFGAYFTYTPTWTATGTAPAIGNATVVARYCQIGKFVHCHGYILFGTTSTYGTGSYRFALPVTSSGFTYTGGAVLLIDASTGNFAPVLFRLVAGGTTVEIIYPATYLGNGNIVGQTAPWTWANTDTISWDFTYEAA
jgi:hypothetical protein